MCACIMLKHKCTGFSTAIPTPIPEDRPHRQLPNAFEVFFQKNMLITITNSLKKILDESGEQKEILPFTFESKSVNIK